MSENNDKDLLGVAIAGCVLSALILFGVLNLTICVETIAKDVNAIQETLEQQSTERNP